MLRKPSQVVPKKKQPTRVAGTRKPAGMARVGSRVARRTKARRLPGPAYPLIDVRRGATLRLVQTLLQDPGNPANRFITTDASGVAALSWVLSPALFSSQISGLSALFNNIELVAMTLHWTKATDIGIKGQVAIGFDPATDTSTPTLDSIIRHPNSWTGMTWSEKALEFRWPPDLVRGPVKIDNDSFFPANKLRAMLAIEGAAGNTTAGRIWLTALVLVSGQK